MRLVGRGRWTVVCWQVGISGPHWSATASGQTRGVPVKTVTGSEVILAFVNEVGEDAEHLNHHPDIHILWNVVILIQSTHSVGGLTLGDFEIARRISNRHARRRARR